jgi:hypothetical protein
LRSGSLTIAVVAALAIRGLFTALVITLFVLVAESFFRNDFHSEFCQATSTGIIGQQTFSRAYVPRSFGHGLEADIAKSDLTKTRWLAVRPFINFNRFM